VILSRPGRSGEEEPGVEAIRSCVHKRRALNSRLSSGTSAGTFACPAGPYRNCKDEAGAKNEPKWYFVPIQKKGSESRSSRFEPKILLISFLRCSGPPLSLHWYKQETCMHVSCMHLFLTFFFGWRILIVISRPSEWRAPH